MTTPPAGSAQSPAPTAPTPPTGVRTILGHPPGLFLLFLVEMWERFSYYGMRGLLVLYLTAAIAAHQLAPGTYTNTLQIDQTVLPTAEERAAQEAAADAAAKAGTKYTPPPTPTGADRAPDKAGSKYTQRLPMTVKVGQAPATPAGAAPAVEGDAGPLKFQRMRKQPNPAKRSGFEWVPVGEGLSPAQFIVDAGTPTPGDDVRFVVSNPTDRDVELRLKLLRPMSAAAQDEAEKRVREKADLAARGPGGSPMPADELAAAVAAARAADDVNYKVYFKFNDSTGVATTKIRPDSNRDAEDDPFELSLDINRTDSGRSWTRGDASTLYGWYTGMAYLLPILGGIIADRLIGTHRSMVVGGILIALGHIVLGLSGIGSWNLDSTGMSVFVLGLALITVGTGHFKPSVSVMVGQLYPPGDPRRESAFSIFYMGINVGAFTCNLVCGTLAVTAGWHYGFAAAAVGMLAGLFIYLLGRKRYLGTIGDSHSPSARRAWVFLPLGLGASSVIAYLFHIGVLGWFDDFVSHPAVFTTIAVLAVAGVCAFVARQLPGDRGPVATIFIYMLFNAVFWLAFEQAGSSLNTFTDEQTSRSVSFMDGRVPTSWFQSINPLLIILLAPIFGVLWASLLRRGKSVPQPTKIGLGLIFVGLGYGVMVLAALKLNTGVAKVSMIYICGCYFLHTVGEIILSPTGLSYVAKTAPAKAVSSLMGIWFLSSFVAGLMAGKVGSLVEPIIEGKVKLPWNLGGQADFFLLFVITSCAAGVLIIAITPLLVKLQRSPKD